jgi:hypothetical protein
MMSQVQQGDVRITITSSEESVRGLVGGIIHKALEDTGFIDITHLDEDEVAIEMIEVPTILDIVIQECPTLFETPITIIENDISEDEKDLETIRRHEDLEDLIVLSELDSEVAGNVEII